MGLKLIVNADDFGLSGEVNEGIRLAHLKGVLTSTSIMPVGESFAEAVALSSTLPELDIGIHLTLVGERPLLPAERVSTLVDENGRFHAHATVFMRRFLQGKIDRNEVHAELEAQVRKVLASGLDVSHLDTHQHLHALPAVLTIVTSIAKQHGILRIRRPAERLRRYMFGNPGALGRVAQMLVLNSYCRAGDWQDLRHPAAFAGFFFGGRLSVGNLATLLDSLPDEGTCELMCHPGAAAESDKYADWQYGWTDELDALVDDALPERLEAKRIQLISYRDI